MGVNPLLNGDLRRRCCSAGFVNGGEKTRSSAGKGSFAPAGTKGKVKLDGTRRSWFRPSKHEPMSKQTMGSAHCGVYVDDLVIKTIDRAINNSRKK